MDFMVAFELPRRMPSSSVTPLLCLEKLPYRLGSDLTLDFSPQLCWFPGFHAGQGLAEPPPLYPASSDLTSVMYRGGGNGGGAKVSSSRVFGMDIGIEEDKQLVDGRDALALDRPDIILRSEGFEL